MDQPSVTNKKLRVFFIPFFAPSHMHPMSTLAVLFARHPDVDPTICLTPANADVLRPTLENTGVSILLYPFPSEAVGLPAGKENLSSVPTDQEFKIYEAVDHCEDAHRELLHKHRPHAVVADIPFWWTTGIARDLGIPRITWHTVGTFANLVINSLYKHRRDTINKGNDDVVVVNDLPTGPVIKIPIPELPEFVRTTNFLTQLFDTLKKSQLECYGVVVNTFYELEPSYCDYHRETDCKRAWFVGPVSLARGYDKQKHECLSWLDTKEEGSVVFVCLGSWYKFKDEQLKQIAMGLEDSRRPFLWVVRKGQEDWMPDDEWEKRVEGRGLVVRGWAPQAMILEHKAVGVFMTHCGWNSVLESVTAGKPMLTWPLTFDQFINEKLVIDVMGIGEKVSNGFRSTLEEEKVVVPSETISRAVSGFMEKEANEGRKMTEANKYVAMARTAVAKGGSSRNDLNSMIDGLRELRELKSEGT